MKNYVNYSYKRVRKMGVGGEVLSAGAGLASNAIDTFEGDYPTAGGGALSGALSGAAAGSVIPGIGTAVGAVVGGVAGFIGGQAKAKAAKEARDNALAQKNESATLVKLGNSRASLQNFPQSGLQYTPFQLGEGGPIKGGTLAAVNVRARRTPVVVNNLNDPRLKAYKDSLSLYEKGKAFRARFYNEPVFNSNREAADFSFGLRQEASSLISRSKIKPVAYQDLQGVDQPNGTYTVGWQGPVYKKPTQPVVFEKPRRHIEFTAEPIVREIAAAANLVDRVIPIAVSPVEAAEQPNPVMEFVSPAQKNGESNDDYVKRVHALRVKSARRTLAKGGYLPEPLYKAEGGEVIEHQPGDVPLTDSRGTIRRLSANTSLIVGDKHSAPSGGVGMANEQPARIFSDQLFIPLHLQLELIRF